MNFRIFQIYFKNFQKNYLNEFIWAILNYLVLKVVEFYIYNIMYLFFVFTSFLNFLLNDLFNEI